MRFLIHIIFIATFVGIPSLKAAQLDSDETNQCANAKMRVCNEKVKKAFLKGGKKGLSTPDIYCSSMRELAKCVESQLQSGTNLCNSDKLRKYHFVVMSYLRMDKLMATCTEDMKDNFKDKVMEQFLLVPEFKTFQEFRTLAFEENPASVSVCAKKAHAHCITLFTKLEQEDQELCKGVESFIQCYQDHKCPTNRLSVTFAGLINEMSLELINAFEDHSMCKVDKTEL